MDGENVYAAAHGLIERDGLWLITRRARTTDYMPGMWDIPGGTIEYGESPEGALMREILEETGLSVEIGGPIIVYNNLSQFPGRQTFQIVYRCAYLSGDVRLDPEEHEDSAWCDRREAVALDLMGFARAAIERSK